MGLAARRHAAAHPAGRPILTGGTAPSERAGRRAGLRRAGWFLAGWLVTTALAVALATYVTSENLSGGDYAAAAEAYNEALRRQPNDTRAVQLLAAVVGNE